MADEVERWRYRHAIKSCVPYFHNEYRNEAEVDALLLEMGSKKHLNQDDWDDMRYINRPRDKVRDFLECQANKTDYDFKTLFDDLVSFMNADSCREQFALKLQKKLAEAMELTEEPQERNELGELRLEKYRIQHFLTKVIEKLEEKEIEEKQRSGSLKESSPLTGESASFSEEGKWSLPIVAYPKEERDELLKRFIISRPKFEISDNVNFKASKSNFAAGYFTDGGGTLQLTDGSAKLTIPPHAMIDSDKFISLYTYYAKYSYLGRKFVTRVLQCGPEGIEFCKPVRLSFTPYISDCDDNESKFEYLYLYTCPDKTPEEWIFSKEMETGTDDVFIEVDHFSWFTCFFFTTSDGVVTFFKGTTNQSTQTVSSLQDTTPIYPYLCVLQNNVETEDGIFECQVRIYMLNIDDDIEVELKKEYIKYGYQVVVPMTKFAVDLMLGDVTFEVVDQQRCTAVAGGRKTVRLTELQVLPKEKRKRVWRDFVFKTDSAGHSGSVTVILRQEHQVGPLYSFPLLCPHQGITDRHMLTCMYQMVDCPLSCGHQVLKWSLDTHVVQECLRRIEPCHMCMEDMEVGFMAEHSDVCPMKEVTCDYCKEVKVFRKDLIDHHGLCDEFPVSCSYKQFGCESEMRRRELSEHEAVFVQRHMALMMKSVTCLQNDLTTTTNDLTTTKDHLTTTMNDLTTTKDDLTTTKDHLTTTMNDLTTTKDQLTTTMNDLTTTKDQLTTTMNDLTTTTNDLTTTKNDLTTTMNDLTTTKDQLTTTMNDLTTTKDQLTTNMNDLTTTKDQLTTTMNDLSTTKDQLTTTMNDLTTTKDQLTTTMNDLTTTKDELNTTKDKLAKAMDELNAKCAENKKLTEDLKEQHEKSVDKIDKSVEKNKHEPEGKITQLSEDTCQTLPFTWKVEMKRNMETKESGRFYTKKNGYKLYVRAGRWYGGDYYGFGCRLTKGENDKDLRWPMEGNMSLTVRDATSGELLGSDREIGAGRRPETDDYYLLRTYFPIPSSPLKVEVCVE